MWGIRFFLLTLASPKFLRSVGAQAQAESYRSGKFKNIWFSSRLSVTLASPKSLLLEKTQKHLVFFSLIRNFVGEILKKQRYMANTTPTAEDLLLSEEDIKLRYNKEAQ